MEALTINGGNMTVRKFEPVMVHPESEIPNGFYFLSSLDQAIPFTVKTIYRYEKGSDIVGDVLRQALSKVLVHYYPFTGSMAMSPEGGFIVELTKKGVPFVEAEADCSMNMLGDIRVPDPDVTNKLIYSDPKAKTIFETPLLTAQVTKFKCGGFTLGVGMYHSLVDGVSGMNFVNSWAQIARGKPVTTVPFHDRTRLKSRVPPQIKYPYDDFVQIADASDTESLYQRDPLVHKLFVFDADRIAATKKLVLSEGKVKCCSSFAAVTALVWRAWSEALRMKPHQLTKLRIMADFRSKFETETLPEHYFGNAVVTTASLCSAGELHKRPISFAVEQIQKALELLDEEYVRSRIDFVGVYKPQLSSVGTLVISSWTRLAYGMSDFGWGGPSQFGCGDLGRELCVYFPEGDGKKGIAVVLALPLSAMNAFEELVQV
ncbi:omega-hydroxypalmitate O-feruloyl transferase [Eucalyptus grandis]|uniref:omega-hydroxypalmitate O-feruloyl transferase n=1 Tax=Eucalyptus grandis TaxID=71139 RepID=UPI00192ECE7B|nr:omega-hydroxypalmitate O-feruloyl transferase [Eucalyptus grandis]